MDPRHAHPSLAEDPGLRGHRAIDHHGHTVGTVADVLVDRRTGQPSWALVRVGLRGSPHLVPLVDSYRATDGRVVLFFDKATVRRSPKVGRELPVERETLDRLRRHYDVAS